MIAPAPPRPLAQLSDRGAEAQPRHGPNSDPMSSAAKLSYRELQAALKARGLPAVGKTAALRVRLQRAESKAAAKTPSPGSSHPPAVESNDDSPSASAATTSTATSADLEATTSTASATSADLAFAAAAEQSQGGKDEPQGPGSLGPGGDLDWDAMLHLLKPFCRYLRIPTHGSTADRVVGYM